MRNKKILKKEMGNITFSLVADLWINSKKTVLAKNSFLYYKSYVKTIKEFFRGKKIQRITYKEIDTFLSKKAESGCIGKTNLYYYHIFKSIFDFAVKAEIIEYNPVDRVTKPKRASDFKPKYYDVKQLRNLLELLNTEDFYLKVPISILIAYGLRRSEMAGLMWSSVDFEKKEIHINHKTVELHNGGKKKILTTGEMKTKSSKRVLPLIPAIEKMLLEFKNKLEENRKKYKKTFNKKYADYICVTKKGKLITPAAMSTGFQKFLRVHNLPHIRLHDLRHSSASMLLANGVPMKAIQDWLGHENFDTTADVYSHIDYQSKKESANVIQKLIFKRECSFEIDFDSVNQSNYDVVVKKLLRQIKVLENKLAKKQKGDNK